jgi:hypothetical protein
MDIQMVAIEETQEKLRPGRQKKQVKTSEPDEESGQVTTESNDESNE